MTHVNSPSRRRFEWLVIVLVVALPYLLLFGFLRLDPNIYLEWERKRLVGGVAVGMTRTELIKRKGPPAQTVHSIEMEPAHYVPLPTFPVEKEVLEYYRFPWKLYVYIGRDGRVTHVFTART